MKLPRLFKAASFSEPSMAQLVRWFSLLLPKDVTVSSLNQECKQILRCDDPVLPQVSIVRYEIVADLSD